ncbi:TldD/PmbA family protein [Leptospira sp. 'Mane']|uniref:TldD/PmbA family protein n=1 Tax=Leptospira sp. 'Mane' TaxID=3387407 RepID=UPI00398B902B
MDKAFIEKKLNEQKNHLESLVKKAKDNGISQVEIFSSYGYAEEVTLEKNDLNNCTATEENMFGIRVIENGSQGFLTTNHFPSLWESIQEARDLARSQTTPDSDLVLPDPQELEKRANQYDESLDSLGLENLVEIAKTTLNWKKELFPKVNLDSGDMSLSKGFKLIVSSKGIGASELGAGISASVMGMAVDGSDVGSFDYDSASGNDYPYFAKKWERAFREFGEKCMGGLGAKTIPGFKGYVLLPPDAVYSFFLGSFIGSLNGTSIRKGKSKMAGKLGKQVASSKLSIWEDPTIDNYAGTTSFDREGQATHTQSILNQGILDTYFYNTYEAKKAGLKNSNGFATGGAQSLPGCGPRQLQIAPGDSNKEDFFKMKEKVLFVNRLSGTSDGPSGDFSGVIKGSYLLENGVKTPVKEVQIVGNVFDALNQIVGISKEGELLGESYWAPYMLLEGFTITGAE